MGKKYYPERESKHLEFKSVVPKKKSGESKFDGLIKTCIAFANAAGGEIIIGVEDNTHEILGINDDDRHRIYDDFAKSLYDSTSPSLLAQIYEKSFGEHSVLIVEIPAGHRKPYFLTREGMSNGTYIRVGSATCKANQEYIEDLAREAQRIHYDEEILPYSIDILSPDHLNDFFGSRVTKKRLLAEKIIAVKPANKEVYVPTVAGALIFAEKPHEYIPEALVRCTLFKGTEGRDILQTEDVTGPIEQQATNSLRVISRWMATHYALQGVKVKEQLPIPIEALREAIVNALLHRKYNIPGAIKIAVYENRVEIFSPGCFPGAVDINHLGDGTTFLRNPLLVRLAYQIRLVETRGTGIRLMYESCKKAGLKKPEFDESGDFVKVSLFFTPDAQAYETEDEAIVALIMTKKSVTAQEVANYLGVSRNTAIRKLGHLIATKQLKKAGRGPTVRYLCLE